MHNHINIEQLLAKKKYKKKNEINPSKLYHT